METVNITVQIYLIIVLAGSLLAFARVRRMTEKNSSPLCRWDMLLFFVGLPGFLLAIAGLQRKLVSGK